MTEASTWQWRPIESAPTTGYELILVLTPSRIPRIALLNSWRYEGFFEGNKPTHWLPIPPPPSTEERAETRNEPTLDQLLQFVLLLLRELTGATDISPDAKLIDDLGLDNLDALTICVLAADFLKRKYQPFHVIKIDNLTVADFVSGIYSQTMRASEALRWYGELAKTLQIASGMRDQWKTNDVMRRLAEDGGYRANRGALDLNRSEEKK